ncbi:MAG: amino acid ABC transporter substrate-binding protein [Truepera sp.]|nr:amino acid ABC transporter substrate-binding protein [Truepera sp.]
MNVSISRRKVVSTLGVASAALAVPTWVGAQRTSIKVGWAISRTGPFSGGAATTQWPNYLLWIKDVNDAGGLSVDGRKLKLEHIEYDDRSQSEEALRAVQRLITQDRVDILLTPWGTGMNLAVAPIFARAGFPMLATTFASERMPEFARRWPNLFSMLNLPSAYSQALIPILAAERAAGRIGDRVAMVHVIESFGLELVNPARDVLRAANFNIVYDEGYPMGAADLTPVLTAAQRANPDVFIAFSYPPDTIALTELARVRNFNPRVFYVAIGTAFPMFKQRFGDNAVGVMGFGGWNPENDAIRSYFRRHVAMHNREPDRSGSSHVYASLQALGQTIEKVGLSRPEIIKHLGANRFDTIIGGLEFDENNIRKGGWFVGQWQDGDFFGIAPIQPGARRPLIPKPAWRT